MFILLQSPRQRNSVILQILGREDLKLNPPSCYSLTLSYRDCDILGKQRCVTYVHTYVCAGQEYDTKLMRCRFSFFKFPIIFVSVKISSQKSFIRINCRSIKHFRSRHGHTDINRKSARKSFTDLSRISAGDGERSGFI